MQNPINFKHFSKAVIKKSIINIPLVLSVFALFALVLQFSVGFVTTNTKPALAATSINSLIVTNCDLDGKGSLIPRFGLTNGNNWYTIDATGGRTANENLPILCNNKSFAENITNLERSSYYDLEVKTSLNSNTCAYTATPITYMIRFASQACNDTTVLGKGSLRNLSSFPINLDSILHVSYCKSNTSVTDILPLINIDSNPGLVSQCDGISGRTKAEADQSIKLFTTSIQPTTPSTIPTYKTPSYPNLPGLEAWTLEQSADFNNDGNRDVLWRNKVSGDLVLWYLNEKGNFISGTNTPVVGDGVAVGVPVPATTGWNISAVGDVNADGNKDLIWNHSSGAKVIWYLDAQRKIVSGDTLPHSSTDWDIVASVDTNNDKKDDLIWRHKTAGYIVLWQSGRAKDAIGQDQYVIAGGGLLATFPDYNAKIYGAYQSNLQKGTNEYTIQWHYTDGPAKGQKSEWYLNQYTFKSGAKNIDTYLPNVDYARVG